MLDLLHLLDLLEVLTSSPWKFWNSFSKPISCGETLIQRWEPRYTLDRKCLVPGLHSVWTRVNDVILQFDSRWTKLNKWNSRIWKQWAYVEQAESWCQHFLWSHTLISQNKHSWKWDAELYLYHQSHDCGHPWTECGGVWLTLTQPGLAWLESPDRLAGSLWHGYFKPLRSFSFFFPASKVKPNFVCQILKTLFKKVRNRRGTQHEDWNQH